MLKIINPGSMPGWNLMGDKVSSQVFVKIEYKESEAELKEKVNGRYIFASKTLGTGRLSISGVVGPKSNGDCTGSCGQISDTIRDAIKAGEFTPNEAQGWTVPDVLSFCDMWDQYHLNDMHPECEHQRAAGWHEMAGTKLKSYTWTLKSEIRKQQSDLQREAIDRAASVATGRDVGFSKLEKTILKLESFITTKSETLDDLARFYEATRAGSAFPHVKETARGWMSYSEDDRGLLGKPCEKCGYKYGSEWKLMPLSKNVLDTFEALPETNTKPAWV